MPDTPINPEAFEFYDAAEKRLRTFMIVIGILATAALTGALGWRFGLGVAFGCAVAYLNFHWLKRIVKGMADRAVNDPENRPSTRAMTLKFMMRYALLIVAAYVILSVSLTSLYGLLCGLFLPVAAIMVEAVYELFAALRRGY